VPNKLKSEPFHTKTSTASIETAVSRASANCYFTRLVIYCYTVVKMRNNGNCISNNDHKNKAQHSRARGSEVVHFEYKLTCRS